MEWSDDYLEHHGILGQKWGVRRFESANGHLTAAGLKRYADGRKVTAKEQNTGLSVKKKSISKVDSTGKKENSKEETTEKKGLTDKQKKMIIAGAAVVGTAVAAYGGYKLYQHVQNTKKEAHDLLIERGNQATMKALQSEHAKEMSAVRDYVEAKNSRDGHHTNNGGLLVDPEAYKNHWVGVAQKNKAEINKAHEDYMKKAGNISSSYRQSKKYLKYTKNNKEGDIANREWYLNGYDLNHFTKKENSTKAKATSNSSEKVKKFVSQNVTRTTPPPIPKSEQTKATNKLASEASALARAVTTEGPKSFSKSAQNAGQVKGQMTQQKLKSAQKSVNTGSKSVSKTIKISGQTKFNQASKANDDFVNDLLKKNSKLVSNF